MNWEKSEVCPEGEYGKTTVYLFECGGRQWRPGTDVSFWDLYDSDMMLALMLPFTNEEAAAVLEEMGAFTEEAWQ